MMLRTQNAVIIFVINILIRSEKFIFTHRSLIWKYRDSAAVNDQLCQIRDLITSICNDLFNAGKTLQEFTV